MDSASAPNAGGAGVADEDYMDKGLDAVEKKFGADTSKLRATNEKITDFVRKMIEKVTGKKMPAKWSN
ncbi:hypothetical protein IMSHALPRED_005449 [Imshaugia aleurites]|uniref:Uncharacterized protein n=1 Tax=Imshaugia aleurites TaxID=172621 RepID=A0A8H3EI34_9LECA|nr:hypothetical protein IMSHALPRED_005449 [Imshaugia aleurites]